MIVMGFTRAITMASLHNNYLLFFLCLKVISFTCYDATGRCSNAAGGLHLSQSDFFLHIELNYFTGVNGLTPLTNFPHTFKNEEKDIPHLVTKKFASKIQLGVSHLVEFSSRSILGHQVR